MIRDRRARSRLQRAVRALLPWGSLALGVASALWMNRRPERAWLIALAAGAGFVLLSLFAVLRGLDPTRLAGNQALVARVARFSTGAAAQSFMQLCLFFSVPFFAEAAAVPAHFVFVGILVVAGAITLWDPLHGALLERPLAGALLQAIATFSGLDCVLPVLGLSNRVSLLAAAGVAAVGLPIVAWLTATTPRQRAGNVALALVVGALLPIGLALGAARFVPPAPLRFVAGAIGTTIVDRQLVDPAGSLDAVPAQLVCFTAIAAPRGLRDRIRHVWRRDGAVAGEVSVEIRGGRSQGFRTWSFKHNLAPGRWTCTVETESGQLLGRATLLLGAVQSDPR